MRPIPLRVSKKMLLPLPVILPVGDKRVLRDSILIRHCLQRLRPPCRMKIVRRKLIEPLQMIFATMALRRPVAMAIFLAESEAELAQPHVVVETLMSPDGTRMLLVLNRAVSALLRPLTVRCIREIRYSRHQPLCRVEQLRCLQNHLHNMPVAVPPCTL